MHRSHTGKPAARCMVALLAAALLTLSGCDRARVQQWATFAEAGTAYVGLFQHFADEAGQQAVAADSAALITARDLAGAQVPAHRAEFTADLARSDAQMRQYLANIRRLETQAALLGGFFDGITRLTQPGNSAGVLAGMNAVADALNTVNPDVETVQFAGKGVKDYLRPASALLVAHIESRALQQILQRDAPAVDRALALQEAAVTVLAAQAEVDREAAVATGERTLVLQPYLAPGPLPSGWARDRAATLLSDDARRGAGTLAAIQALRASFRALVAGEAQPAAFGSVWRAAGAVPVPGPGLVQ